MASPKLSRLELQLMEALWQHGPQSVRDVKERLPAKKRPAYTTVQTMMYRLEAKKAVRRTGKSGNAHIFQPVISRVLAETRLVDDFLGAFGGRMQPLMVHLVQSGKLTLDDVKEAEQMLIELAKKGKHK
jgi:predicted transcriptional regulator